MDADLNFGVYHQSPRKHREPQVSQLKKSHSSKSTGSISLPSPLPWVGCRNHLFHFFVSDIPCQLFLAVRQRKEEGLDALRHDIARFFISRRMVRAIVVGDEEDVSLSVLDLAVG